MQQGFGLIQADIEVWLSPAAGRESYPLYDFNNRSLHEVAIQQLLEVGIFDEHIEIDGCDKTTDPALFSHSEFLNGNQPSDGRQTVVAIMKEYGVCF